MRAEYVTAKKLTSPHGFFTRRGGVSEGPYASLNCSLSSADAADRVASNRARVAEAMGVPFQRLLGLTQVHGARVVTVTAPWTAGSGPEADGMVACERGLALGIVTADCAPVLFEDAERGIVGAAHAGWRGACAGILEAMVEAMVDLGAQREALRAAIGPCIAQPSYEVGEDLRSAVLSATPDSARRFASGSRSGHWQFDLSGYCLDRLQRAGVAAEALSLDTFGDEARFFSHRRRTLRQSGPIGHQISVIKT